MSSQKGQRQQSSLGLRGEVNGVALSFALLVGENSVGANLENTVVLSARGVSRRHAIITCEDGRVHVQDLGSKNGTFVNGVRVTTAELQAGDVVSFGPVHLRLTQLRATDTKLMPIPRSSAPPTAAREQSTAGQGQMPASWLAFLEPWLQQRPPWQPGEWQVVLQTLLHTLQAPGVLVVQWSRHLSLTVLHCAGAMPEPSVLERCQELASSIASAEASPEGIATFMVDDITPPLAVAVRAGGGVFTAVVVVGDFPARHACNPLLTLLARTLIPGEPHPAAPRTPPLSSAQGKLVFPPNYVPGRSPAMRSVYHQVDHLLVGTLPVLISGETGVGKEPIARILHLSSPRCRGPFVAVNCAAIPTELLEVELFGIESGVATGVAKREGKFLLAHGGVIFLDEISDMSPALQAKLLRVLQEGEVNPVGARRPVPVDVRVISATNQDLLELVARGRFRQDLYFRVAGYTLRVPPLRERREDIPELVIHFFHRFTQEVGKTPCGIAARALEMLVEAPWPGNVRQLENEVRRLAYLCLPNQPITAEMVSGLSLFPGAPADGGPGSDEDLNLQRQTEALERKLILSALQRGGGRVTKAAQLLGLSRQGLRLKMYKLGLGGLLEREHHE